MARPRPQGACGIHKTWRLSPVCDCFVLQILFAAGLVYMYLKTVSDSRRESSRKFRQLFGFTALFGRALPVGVDASAVKTAQPLPTRTPLRKLVQTYHQLRARSARSWRHSIRRPYSGRISFGLLCTRSRRVASSAISNCCRSGTFVRAPLFSDPFAHSALVRLCRLLTTSVCSACRGPFNHER